MRTFQRVDASGIVRSPQEIEIDSEYLGMTTRERELITGASSDSLFALWDYPPNSELVRGTNGLQHVRNFLTKSGLSYDELIELLDTNYINQNPSARIGIQPDSSCNIDDMTLSHLDETALKRIVSFVRLWKRVGWTMHEVDLAIKAVGFGVPAEFGPFLVRQLADVARVRAALNLKVGEVLTFWSTIDTDGENSLYSRLFLNEKVTDPVDPAFRLKPDGSDVLAESPIADHIPAILAAMRIKAVDLDVIRTDAGLEEPDSTMPSTPLNLENLSKLYRYAVLARGLKLSM